MCLLREFIIWGIKCLFNSFTRRLEFRKMKNLTALYYLSIRAAGYLLLYLKDLLSFCQQTPQKCLKFYETKKCFHTSSSSQGLQ